MPIPTILEGPSVTRLFQGAIFGFFATVVIGFNWGGWMMESTAKQLAAKDTSAALVAVLAPMCAEKFQGSPDAALNMAEFKKTNSWMQDSFIQKGGWATFPGMNSPDPEVARGCANLLAAFRSRR